MFYIGTIFRGKSGGRDCTVNNIIDRYLYYKVSSNLVGYGGTPVRISDAEKWVRDGSWIIVKQPFKAYYDKLLRPCI